MKSNRKFLYAIGTFAAVKLLLLSIFFSLNGDVFGYRFPIGIHLPELVFKFVFLLFIISPPLIVVMLFLIWKELKNKNKLK